MDVGIWVYSEGGNFHQLLKLAGFLGTTCISHVRKKVINFTELCV